MDIPHPRQICSRPSAEQIRALLDELESHPHLTRGRSRGEDGRRRSDDLWRQITLQLNNISGCTKTHKQWQKFWADKKSAVKKQVFAKEAEGLTVAESAFNDIDLRIINIIEKVPDTIDDGHSKSPVNNLYSYYTMSDPGDCNDDIPLTEVPVETEFLYEVKKEPSTRIDMKRRMDLRKRRIQLKKPSTINSSQILKHLVRLEKRRTEHEERTSATLASIASCMKRQEESTQKLTRVLLQLVPRENLSHSRIQSAPPSTKQVIALLEELESNPCLAHGKLRKRSTPLWKAITEKLNDIEGCNKTAKQWMKYWADKKVSIKRLLESARVDADSGGAEIISTRFSKIDFRIIGILEHPKFNGEQDYTAPESPMEAEYLENDYLSESNEDSYLTDLQNPLTNNSVHTKSLRVKQELNMKNRGIQKPRSKKKIPLTPSQMFQKLLRLEERQINAQEMMTNALADIEICMRRQEESTRELSRVLLRLLR